MPRWMEVPLTQISKATYYRARDQKEKMIASRPIGFISMDEEKRRTMYISLNGNYYSGMLMDWQYTEDFMNMTFNGVNTQVKAEFISPALVETTVETP